MAFRGTSEIQEDIYRIKSNLNKYELTISYDIEIDSLRKKFYDLLVNEYKAEQRTKSNYLIKIF